MIRLIKGFINGIMRLLSIPAVWPEAMSDGYYEDNHNAHDLTEKISELEKDCRRLDEELIAIAAKRFKAAEQSVSNNDTDTIDRESTGKNGIKDSETDVVESGTRDLIPVPEGKITPLMLACSSDNTSLSEYGAKALMAISDRQSDDRLLAVISARNAPAVYRSKAIESIGKRRLIKARDMLVKALQDPAANIRYSALRALGELGINPEPLIEKLQDENHFVRTAAVHALARLGAVDAGKFLFDCLKDSSSLVVQSAEEALVSFGECVYESSASELRNNQDEKVRMAALKILKRIAGHENLTDILLAASKDPSVSVRQEAVDGLMKLDDPELLDPLLEALKSIDDDLLKEARAFTADVRRAESEQSGGRAGLLLISNGNGNAEKISPIPSPEEMAGRLACDSMIKALKSDSLYIRGAACYTIARLEIREAMEDLINVAKNDKESYVRQAAVNALGQIGFDAEYSESVTKMLVKAFDDSSRDVVCQAIITAGVWKNPELEKELYRFLSDDYHGLNALAREALNFPERVAA